MLDIFYFNNAKNYTDKKVIVSKSITFPISNEDVEEISVEGRSGNLTILKGTYPDKKISVNISIQDYGYLWDKILEVEEWLTDINDNRLIFYNRQDKCYRVKRVILGDLSEEIGMQGTSTVTFICEPFLEPIIEKEIDVTSKTKIQYSGNIQGEPLIKIWGTGNLQLEINDEVFLIKDVEDYVEIDSKYLTCMDSNGLNLECLGNYPIFSKGINTIAHTGNITQIKLLKRTRFRN